MEEQDKAMRSQSLAIARCYCVIVVVTGANGGAR